MGQGYSLTTLSAGSASIDAPELVDLSYEQSLGQARFMKAIRSRHRDGLVVAKVVMKPYASLQFEPYIETIMRERKILADIPNALGYHRAFETATNGYLIRQFIHSSLYDRMSNRPNLENVEKRWLAFQLLNAIRDCHAQDVYHGDIKTENTLVTSWNWLYLTDFSSSFKPTYLPEDNPADFSFFFDISGRRTCYLAPERFLGTEDTSDGGCVTWAMDIFSVGCVIAELFIESPPFTLSQLFRYRKGDFDPEVSILNKIDDKDIREMVAHMIQLEPESRYSADEYLNFWRQKAFPEYFYSFLHQYMHLITDPTSGRSEITACNINLGESDERIERVFNDFDKIYFFLGYEFSKHTDIKDKDNKFQKSLFPLHVDIPQQRQLVQNPLETNTDDGTILFLNIVTSAMRSTARAAARIKACDLLLVFAERIPDEVKLDRVLPFVVELMNDEDSTVKVAAIRTVSQLLLLISTASPSNAYLFPQYIIPVLTELFQPIERKKTKPEAIVRITYAQCVAPLAEKAAQFLDTMEALKAEGSLPAADADHQDGTWDNPYHDLYDVARGDLVRFFESQTKTLLTDNDTNVRRAFLSSVTSLCVFFGSAKASDVILSHLNTYLNDRDWRLKCNFFDTIVGVATFIGGRNLEEFILPLLLQALSDPEEFVVEKVLRCLTTMAELGLFERATTWELIDLVARFSMHPNTWIREASATFVSASTKFLSIADCECIVKPLMEPYLRLPFSKFSVLELLENLKKPLSRNVFEMAVSWALQTNKGIFWTIAKSSKLMDRLDRSMHSKEPSSLAKVDKKDEDRQWITRLRNNGLGSEDEFKLLALREHIGRMSKRRPRRIVEPETQKFDRLLQMSEERISMINVVASVKQRVSDALYSPSDRDDISNVRQPQTISDALLDASTTIGPPQERKTINGSDRALPKTIERLSGSGSGGTTPRISSPLSASPISRGLNEVEVGEHVGRKVSKPNSLADTSRNDSQHRTLLGESSQQKGTAMDLMQRQIGKGKATAAIATSSTNAEGVVDGSAGYEAASKTAIAAAVQEKQNNPSKIKFRDSHSYEGNDPSVLRYLDSAYLESINVEAAEFGPSIRPIGDRHDRKRGGRSSGRWKPEGNLVALFGEHTGPVTRVVVSPDHSFFLTGSDDGTVKIWDTGRLERNLAHRSRQTHRHAAGSKITGLCFIEETHCFISTASDGSVHVVKVDCSETSQGDARYGKLHLLRDWRLPEPDSHAVWIYHYKSHRDSQSTLMLATNTSSIQAIALKTMTILYTLHNPISHGVPTCFTLTAPDPSKARDRHWLLLGTTHGVLDLWDLRFRIRLRAWCFPGASPIHRIAPHPVRTGSRRKHIVVAGGTGAADVCILDLEKAVVREVYRTAAAGVAHANATPYTLLDPDAKPRLPAALGAPDQGVRALGLATHVSGGTEAARHGFFVAAGPDGKVRFWDMERVEASCVVSGLGAEEGQPLFGARTAGAETVVCEEREGTREAKRGRRSTVVSLGQQALLKSHLDVVLDVALVEWPVNMVVSVDRAGMVYVFS